jgi:hypothetical protein
MKLEGIVSKRRDAPYGPGKQCGWVKVKCATWRDPAEIHPHVIDAPERYTLASLRYDVSKLRAKQLIVKVPRFRRYRLLPQGFERIYAPLTAGLLSPIRGDARLQAKNDPSSIASINALSTISTQSAARWASKPRESKPKTRTRFPFFPL